MQRRTINILLAICLTASILLVLAPGALSQGMHHGNNTTKAMNIDEMYSAIKVTGMTNSSATYDIMNAEIKTKEGKVATMDFAKPISGQYFFTNDTAYITMGNMTGDKHHKHVMGDYNNATIKVAGASAVVVKKNIKVIKHDKSGFEIQFSGLSVYLPDGTVKSYTLSKPVTITGSKDSKTIKVVGSPELKADIQDALKAGGTFSANAAPVSLKTIDSK